MKVTPYQFLYKYFLIVLLFTSTVGFSQSENNKSDSLKKLLVKWEQNKKTSLSLSDTIKVNLLNKLSNSLIETHPKDALLKTKEALNLAIKHNYLEGKYAAYSNFGKIYINTGDFSLAIQNIEKAILLIKQTKNKEVLGDNYFYLAQCYLFLNNFPETTKKLNQALSIFESLNLKVKQARIYNNFAILYGKQKNSSEELKYYNTAIQLLKNDTSKAGTYLKNIINKNIGLIYCDNNEPEKALAVFLKAYDIDKVSGKPNNFAMNCRSIGTAYRMKKEYTNALKYYNEALEVFQKMENKSGEADTFREIGKVYFETNQLEQAINFTNKGLAISKQIGELESIKFSYKNLSDIYAQMGDYGKAYQNEILHKKYSDSMFNSEINNKVNELQLNFEFEKKQEIAKRNQKIKDEKRAVEAKKQEKILYIIILSLFFVTFAAAIIYWNFKEQKAQNKTVELQNIKIQEALIEKETLLKEIHHRVKNNLQIISSLLNMQTQEIEEEKVLIPIQEAQNRLQVMSLIHESLYKSDNINKINIKEYFDDLGNYLSAMYNINSKKISLEINTNDFLFNYDTAIPLGLIVNELATNAFKHAFENINSGTIFIELTHNEENEYLLSVKNNGNALPSGFNIDAFKSLGFKLVSILSRQLRGNFTFNSLAKTTSFEVRFKDFHNS